MLADYSLGERSPQLVLLVPSAEVRCVPRARRAAISPVQHGWTAVTRRARVGWHRGVAAGAAHGAMRLAANLALGNPPRFAERVTYETASDPINATGSNDSAPSPAR